MTGLPKGPRWIAILAAALLAAAVAAPSAGAQRPADASAYEGLGSWIDIFAYPSWANPQAAVSSLAAHGVTTLYLETSNYSHAAAVIRPSATSRFVEAAHAAGLQVVAWYLPSLANVQVDYRRALGAIRFRTPDGDSFDSFALDIEASVVRNVSVRNARLLSLSRRLRAAVGPDYALGAIIPSPVGMQRHPTYWPSFPYAGLAQSFDVFLPMAYFSYYTTSSSGVYAYTRSVVRQIRTKTGVPDVPIHVIGGLAGGIPAGAMTGFVRALADCAVSGASLYEYPQTTAGQWARLATLGFDASLPSDACR